MKILRMFVLLLVFAWLTPGLPAFAQNEPWTLKGAAKANSRPEPQERQDSSYYQRKGYKLDDRYQHNRYYPPQGVHYKTLPPEHRVVHYHDRDYFFYGGAWYLFSGLGFQVIAPPIGLTVTFLPAHYTTIWVGGIPYYYAGGTYYTWAPQRSVYVVTAPPPQQEVVEEATQPGRLFIYPKQGQSEQKQATDRYECHSWASQQSGFDPTLSGGGVAAEENASRRADYNRAMKACLEARGYSVQ